MAWLRSLWIVLMFWGYIAGKLIGAFADWSWWWVLLPIVPWLGTLIQRVGGF